MQQLISSVLNICGTECLVCSLLLICGTECTCTHIQFEEITHSNLSTTNICSLMKIYGHVSTYIFIETKQSIPCTRAWKPNSNLAVRMVLHTIYTMHSSHSKHA